MKTVFVLLYGILIIQNGQISSVENNQISVANPLTFATREACQTHLIKLSDQDYTIRKEDKNLWAFLNYGNEGEVFFTNQCVEIKVPD
jgi:hypothetical protein